VTIMLTVFCRVLHVHVCLGVDWLTRECLYGYGRRVDYSVAYMV